MKKFFGFSLLVLVVMLTGCTAKTGSAYYALFNYTGETITLDHNKLRAVDNDDYDIIYGVAYDLANPVNPDSMFNQSRRPIRITYDGTTYLIDETQTNGCAWAEAYTEPSSEEYEKAKSQLGKNGSLRVFRLTKDYLKSQIVVTEN